ncbi:hypothetical protein G7Z17_g7108 [Cylindrodendrum hubeiense]|uniref:DUF6606 domain-containing protein n=1 Tax=Cylindrodendrum hubeiense TaxID=595255 RepID=A0A9P5LEH4_9HYPO|nr:hypothetical protein G7Z17_g7108 [Cylindrodendrum hubeiense]
MATDIQTHAVDAKPPKLAQDAIDYFFHHLFLSPKLPGEHDNSSERDDHLINFILDSLKLFLVGAHPDHSAAVKAAICMMENMKLARDSHGCLEEHKSLASFHVKAQNAGVIIRRTDESVIFEVFELSPTNASVHSTRGRLIRQFPATAIVVPSHIFEGKDFRSVLSKTMVKMSRQTDQGLGPKSNEANQLHIEEDFIPFHLASIESWVAKNLDGWLVQHIREESTCIKLGNLIQDYHGASRAWYASRPEGASRMHLVLFELWVAADKAAIYIIPMLKKYEPEVPVQVYQDLLLSFRGDMVRLARAENYLRERQEFARARHLPSVFSKTGDWKSFAIQYFSESREQQCLMNEIERQAKADQKAKRSEFRELKMAYDGHMQVYKEKKCEYREWMEDDLQHTWRDLTIYLIDDVLQCDAPLAYQPRNFHPLNMYQGLTQYLRPNERKRIQLVSEDKSQSATHWRTRSISTISESDVCVSNGFRFKHFDDKKQLCISKFHPSLALSKLCTFKLPPRSNALKCFLARNYSCPEGMTPNEIIAGQSPCPDHMSLVEYKAFVSLPYGHRILWMNILRQLAMPDVDFNKGETAILILQLSLQAGPDDAKEICFKN